MAHEAFEAGRQLARDATEPGVVALLTEINNAVRGYNASHSAFALVALLAVALDQAPDEVRAAAAAVVMLANRAASLAALRVFAEMTISK